MQKKDIDFMIAKLKFLWQDHSEYDNKTAKAVAKLNPAKFIINIDGPGSDFSNPQCGPSVSQLVQFVATLKKNGFTGSLAMHPDTTKSDYQHDWNGKGNLPTRVTKQSWMTYCDYFQEMNQTLRVNSLPVFKEILIETESSYLPRVAATFDSIKTYLKGKALVSTTGDWNGDRANLHVDCFYPQLYDMAYVDAALGGPNAPSEAQADLLATHIVDIVKEKPAMLNDPNVFFTFSYCFNDDDAPVFGQDPRIWPKKDFDYFLQKFSDALSPYTSAAINTGAWHCSILLENWKESKMLNSKQKCKWGLGVLLTSIAVGVAVGYYLTR
tara:strand:- start:129 stop:1103 length:975 start_codon:yes stop_codon:yes gene_type:complete